MDRGRDLHHTREPDDPKDTYAQQGDHYGDEHIAPPPQGSAQYFDKHIDNIPRYDKHEHIRADPDYSLICRKQPEKESPCKDQHGDKETGYGKVHAQTDQGAPAHPVHLPGAVVLPDKRCDRDAEGSADHPEDRVQFAEGGPCGSGVCAKGVDRGLDGDIRDREQDGLKSRGQPELQLHGEERPVETDLPQGETEDPLGACQFQRDKDSADCLCEQRGDGDARNSHVEEEHKSRIQDNVDDTADDQDVERGF